MSSRVLRAWRDHEDPKGHLALTVLTDRRDLRVQKDLPDHKEHLDRRGPVVVPGLQGRKDHQVTPVQPVRKGHLETLMLCRGRE